MSKGYVYILSNQGMPGLVKIGLTTREVAARANELFQTGVPFPFKIEFQTASPDCRELEQLIHVSLMDKRCDPAREFFRATVNEAIDLIEHLHRQQVDEWLNEFLPDHAAVRTDEMLDLANANIIAHETGLSLPEIISAFDEISSDEILPALNRRKAKTERWRSMSLPQDRPDLKLVGEA